MRLHDFPRAALGHFPTPICRLEAISSLINTQVYIKRDDLSGLGLGGNKSFCWVTRKRRAHSLCLRRGRPSPIMRC